MTNLKNGGRGNEARDVSIASVDMKLEVIVIPVSGRRDENWSDWYAEYMAAEQAGTELPT